MTAAQSATVDKLFAQNSDEQNILTETSESAEDNFPSAEILTDVASIFYEHPASAESVNHDKLTKLQHSDKGKGGPPAIALLHSIPMVSEAFCQIAIDIVGPLPVCKEIGNGLILIVTDMCTQFPEAILLKQQTAQDVAKASTPILVAMVLLRR